MRISELSRVSGVPLPTVKYYLREGLLPGGTPTARNQAEYGDEHVQRLRLIRALREVGGLEIGRIRQVVAAIGDGSLSRHELFGVAQQALDAPDRDMPDANDEMRRALADVQRLLEGRGWQVRADAAGRRDLARALVALRRLGREPDEHVLAPYVDAADALASREVAAIPPDVPTAVALERMVVGTVVFGAILTALRRLAHEAHSAGQGSEGPAR